MGIRILIPAKCDGGKTRLTPVMSASARQQLCIDFLENTLKVALSVAETTVIARDERCADVARALGAVVLFDPSSGLNAALDAGRSSTTLFDGIVVCPIDLPWITSTTIRRLTERADAISVVPDRHLSGTNLLWIPAPAVADFKFMFGPHSFKRHVEQGRQLGIAMETPVMEEAGLDVDSPEDFAIWNERIHARGATY
jgi:2-phospho-L-lactate guanylyltransferase